ncbi:hypothetical protein [Pelolinea submarina]|uniref:Lipoprotein n=1 Tax=Pelolinea submarina TaxID=913107 RepID=A0A347ZRU3_9CHLR|nr:hypothetical protein [Pelolinea submarina]REG11426.1 hypothetical protein DFR64_1307 [Pelolinea submarina]BBB48024.1 hypothetical protein Pelsub_P1252 [Pelolinea submarina]
MNKVTKLMVMGIILSTSTAACAKAPAITATLVPTVTPLPTATLAPTETEDPFEGFSICRTWQEAENCPITVADFERLPDFVKANFTFPSEAMKVSWLEAVSMPKQTSFFVIHALSSEEMAKGTGIGSELKGGSKEYIYGGSLSPIGKAFFFTLKANPPETNYDDLVAVFPVNNANGSLGTYTIIQPPRLFQGNYKTAEEFTEATYEAKFSKMPYSPPGYDVGSITEDNIYFHSHDDQGSFIKEIVEDTKNQDNGKRKKLLDEWLKTGIIPKELEKIPLLSASVTLRGGPLDY